MRYFSVLCFLAISSLATASRAAWRVVRERSGGVNAGTDTSGASGLSATAAATATSESAVSSASSSATSVASSVSSAISSASSSTASAISSEVSSLVSSTSSSNSSRSSVSRTSSASSTASFAAASLSAMDIFPDSLFALSATDSPLLSIPYCALSRSVSYGAHYIDHLPYSSCSSHAL